VRIHVVEVESIESCARAASGGRAREGDRRGPCTGRTHLRHQLAPLALDEAPPTAALQDLALVHAALPLRRPVDSDLRAEGEPGAARGERLGEVEGQGAVGDGRVPACMSASASESERTDESGGGTHVGMSGMMSWMPLGEKVSRSLETRYGDSEKPCRSSRQLEAQEEL